MASSAFDGGWTFPDNLPGRWDQEEDGHRSTETHQESGTRTYTSAHGSDSHSSRSELPQQPKPAQNRQRHYGPKTCRICLEVVQPTYEPPSENIPGIFQGSPNVTYSSPDGGRLIRPCLCKGSQKYVHEGCLASWRLQDPTNKRNFWQCPTCRYNYRLTRMTWGRYLSSTASQIVLTIVIFLVATFILGYIADPIIGLYLDPYSTISSGTTGTLLYEDEPDTWTEHFFKGFASLGLLGFAKFFLTLSPWHWFNYRSPGTVRGGRAATGRERVAQISWFTIMVGIVTVLVVSQLNLRLQNARIDKCRPYGKGSEFGANARLRERPNVSWTSLYQIMMTMKIKDPFNCGTPSLQQLQNRDCVSRTAVS